MEQSSTKVSLQLDLRIICIILLFIIAGMLALWRPWDSSATSEKTVQVSGSATVSAEPAEFRFSPAFEVAAANQQAAKDALATKINALVDSLRDLDIAETDIIVSAYSYDTYYYTTRDEGDKTAYATVSVSVDSKDQAQEVQDLLQTTDAEGSLTPYAEFSDAQQKELESQAREAAIADARTKGEQSASLLGAELGDVLSFSETSGFDGYFDTLPFTETLDAAVGSEASLPVLPGEQDLTYQISVTFALK